MCENQCAYLELLHGTMKKEDVRYALLALVSFIINLHQEVYEKVKGAVNAHNH